MIKNVLLAEYLNDEKYAYEIIKQENFNPDYLDKRFKELVGEGNPVWSVTDSTVEIAFEISYGNEGIKWQTYKKLFFENSYRMIYCETGCCEELEEAVGQALISFSNIIQEIEEPDAELEEGDYDDNFT